MHLPIQNIVVLASNLDQLAALRKPKQLHNTEEFLIKEVFLSPVVVDTSYNAISLDTSVDYLRLQQVKLFLDTMQETYPLCRELRSEAQSRLYPLCNEQVSKNYFLGSLAQVGYIFSRLSEGLQLENVVDNLESAVELAALKAERNVYAKQLEQARLALQKYLSQTSQGVTLLEEKKLVLWLH